MNSPRFDKPINLSQVSSPCCHSSTNNHAVIKSAPDPLGSEFFDIFQCGICQSCFTHPIPTNLDSYYPNYYRGYGELTTYFLNAFYNLQAKKWVNLNPITNGKCLEIGCGSGSMLKAISNLGWSVSGIERTPTIAKQAQENCKNATIFESLETVPDGNRYDLIILFNVLEHLDNPDYFISKCNNLLNKSGRVIVVVPNFSSYQRIIFNKNWFHLDPPRHLFHFTKDSLSILLERNGFSIEKTSYISFEHDPIGWIESLLNTLSPYKNLLTRYLSSDNRGFNRLIRFLIVSFSLFFIPISIIFSLASWIAKRGAIIQLVIKKTD